MGVDGSGATASVDLEELLATRLLVQGNSGSGKSHLLRRLLEGSANQVQQVIIDPEGDYAEMENAIVLGDAKRAPNSDEVMTALASPQQNCVVNLIGLALADRPSYFEKLLAGLMHLRARTATCPAIAP